MAQEAFAREANEQREAEGVERVEAGRAGESSRRRPCRSRSRDRGRWTHVRCRRRALLHCGRGVRGGRAAELRAGASAGSERHCVRAATRVHQDRAAGERGAGCGHLLVPEESTDIVDDLRAAIRRRGARSRRDRCRWRGLRRAARRGLRAGWAERGTALRRRDGRGVGARGFAAEVEDVCAVVEHLERVGERCAGIEETGRRRRRNRAWRSGFP